MCNSDSRAHRSRSVEFLETQRPTPAPCAPHQYFTQAPECCHSEWACLPSHCVYPPPPICPPSPVCFLYSSSVLFGATCEFCCSDWMILLSGGRGGRNILLREFYQQWASWLLSSPNVDCDAVSPIAMTFETDSEKDVEKGCLCVRQALSTLSHRDKKHWWFPCDSFWATFKVWNLLPSSVWVHNWRYYYTSVYYNCSGLVMPLPQNIPAALKTAVFGTKWNNTIWGTHWYLGIISSMASGRGLEQADRGWATWQDTTYGHERQVTITHLTNNIHILHWSASTQTACRLSGRSDQRFSPPNANSCNLQTPLCDKQQ